MNLDTTGLGFVGSLGLILNGLASIVLIFWLRRQAKDSAAMTWLLAALLVEAGWAFGITVALSLQMSVHFVSVIESLRAAVWGGCVLTMLSGRDSIGQQTIVANAAALVIKLLGGVIIGLVLLSIVLEALPASADIRMAIHVTFAILVIVSLEQLWRNISVEQRWGVKFLCVAIFGKFAFDVVFFSYVMMTKQADQSLLHARGFVNLMFASLIALSASRVSDLKLRVGFSRAMVFHSTALLFSGLALLLLAAGGYWIRYFGGSLGAVAATIFISGASAAFLVFLGSGAVRAKTRVLIAKHFYRYRFDYRVEWLKMTAALTGEGGISTQTEELPQRALSAIATLVESSGGALWLADRGDVFRCSAVIGGAGGYAAIARDDAVLCFLRTRRWIIDIAQCRADPSTHENLQLPPWLLSDPNAWLVVPLLLDHDLSGVILLKRPRASVPLDWEVRDLLKTVGQQAASYLAMHRNIEAVAEARQFDTFNRRSAFVVHDLKNLLLQLSLVVRNADRHKDNPEFQRDTLATVKHTEGRMLKMLSQLQSSQPVVDIAEDIAVERLIEGAVSSKPAIAPMIRVDVAKELDGISVTANQIRLQRVIGNLIQNASEASGPSGEIRVRARRLGRETEIQVEDNGVGMSEHFVRTRLFRPFVSSKTYGMGIGVFEGREYVRELGGSIEVDSRENVGTVFRLRLPIREPV